MTHTEKETNEIFNNRLQFITKNVIKHYFPDTAYKAFIKVGQCNTGDEEYGGYKYNMRPTILVLDKDMNELKPNDIEPKFEVEMIFDTLCAWCETNYIFNDFNFLIHE